jgi:hypothetical protein
MLCTRNFDQRVLILAAVFLRFAEFGVVAVTLTVTAVGVGGPREVWCNAAFSVAEGECSCAKVFEVDRAEERDDKCRCLFAGAAISWDKPAGCLRKAQGGVDEFNLFLDYRWASISWNVVYKEL